jgi:rod shape-determining protein MreC
VALAFIFLPQSVTDRVRVWAGPALSPLQDLTQGWSLDLADRGRNREAEAPPPGAMSPEEQVRTLENALAEATGLLGEYDRKVRDLSRMRQDLANLPCRLVPAHLVPPEVAGGQGTARLSEGADKGIRRSGAVVVRRIDRGAREALERGEPVLTAAGLVGIVEEVGPMTSTVRLVTDPRTNIMVQIISRKGDQWRAGPEGLARGTEDGTGIRVLHVDHNADVAVGDFVVTSPSPESSLPPYLVLGRVVRYDLKAAALSYELLVEPRVSPAEVREVYVMSPDAGAPGR